MYTEEATDVRLIMVVLLIPLIFLSWVKLDFIQFDVKFMRFLILDKKFEIFSAIQVSLEIISSYATLT